MRTTFEVKILSMSVVDNMRNIYAEKFWLVLHKSGKLAILNQFLKPDGFASLKNIVILTDVALPNFS